MHRQSGRKTYGSFKSRMRKTDKLNLSSPRRGGIRL